MNLINHPLPIDNSISSFKSFSRGASLFVIGVGCLVLFGWALDISVLKSILPGLASMKSNTAFLFILCGISLWMQVRGQTLRIAQACAFIVTLAGFLTLGEYLFNKDFGIDQLLFQDNNIGALHPGRMSPATALAFVLIGYALIFRDNHSGNRFNESLVIAVFAICGLALLGYLYGVSSLYQIGAYSSMALHTSITMLLLSIGIFFARPEQGLMQTILADTVGGLILRRFLPVIIVGPILLGWVRLLGQRAGLYDTAFGLVLMVVSIITTLTVFIWFNARQLTNIDIKRRQLDATLLEREMKLSKLFEILPVGISILDAERNVTYTNPALKKILDISEEGLLKGIYRNRKYLRADETLMPVDELASMRAFKENREIDGVETGVVKENESIVWTEVSAVPVDFPDWKIVVVTSDITERKQAEEDLRANEQRLHLAAAAGEVGIWDWDIVKDELIWDESMYSLYSIDEKDFSGAYDAWISTLHPDDRQFTDGEIQAALHGEREYAPEFRILRPDGIVRVIKATSQTIRDQDGKALRMIGTNIDITERKQAEEEIIKLNTNLEMKVAERTDELAAANKKLHELSIVDELTGLYNRRGFLLHAEQQLLLARRAKYNLLVFYADLDGLKQINDRFGHSAGDEAIIIAGRALYETFRTSDIKARLGGDEFIVLAIEAEEQDAQMLVARLHEQLAENNQSMSIGVVTLNAQNEITLDELIARADEAMYAEKRTKPSRRER
ncbi:MAG: diguanylate cyclase [Anaerolineales bacterium]|nr:diguanylate cyclase [Anaerolineales bacterium]